MPDIRDIRRKARRDLHEALRVPAYYRATADAPWVRVHVRDFTKPIVQRAFGRHDVQLGLADINDADLRILIVLDEFEALGIRFARGGVFSLDVDQAYTVDNLLAQDDITQTASVVKVLDATGFPVPEPN